MHKRKSYGPVLLRVKRQSHRLSQLTSRKSKPFPQPSSFPKPCYSLSQLQQHLRQFEPIDIKKYVWLTKPSGRDTDQEDQRRTNLGGVKANERLQQANEINSKEEATKSSTVQGPLPRDQNALTYLGRRWRAIVSSSCDEFLKKAVRRSQSWTNS